MTDTTIRTSHRRFEALFGICCSRPGCQGGTCLGETAWSVSGDIRYEALCDKCHDREFPAIHYAITSQDGA